MRTLIIVLISSGLIQAERYVSPQSNIANTNDQPSMYSGQPDRNTLNSNDVLHTQSEGMLMNDPATNKPVYSSTFYNNRTPAQSYNGDNTSEISAYPYYDRTPNNGQETQVTSYSATQDMSRK